MANPLVTIESGPRPAGKPDECFYCNVKLGGNHDDECPLVTKIVKIRATVEFDYECPRHWNTNQINFHFQESSWCASNLPDLLNDHMKLNDIECLCDESTFEVLE